MLKRNEGGIIVTLPSLSSEDVQFLPTYLITVFVKYLLMTTEVVRNDWMVHASVTMCEYLKTLSIIRKRVLNSRTFN